MFGHVANRYRCRTCCALFIGIADVKRHMLTHVDNEFIENKCDECGLVFRQYNNLKIHMASKHPEAAVPPKIPNTIPLPLGNTQTLLFDEVIHTEDESSSDEDDEIEIQY